MKRAIKFVGVLLLAAVSLNPAAAQTIGYPDPHLTSIYPAGGQQGQTVAVQMGAPNGLAGAQEVIVDGPAGVTVRDVKAAANGGSVQATFSIAADAPPGRRFVRVVGGGNGLTNFRYFFVGRLPELVETKDSNNTWQTAHEVSLPVVINGRINPDLDVDCFRFSAKAGEHIVAAVLAHGMDSLIGPPGAGVGRPRGFLDTSLELLNERGQLLAAAEDTLGMDPLLEYTIQSDGRYTVRVQSLGYNGSPSAVYRLTLGDLPYPTYVFPPGCQRGQQVEVEFGGPNVTPGMRQKITVPADGSFPLQYVQMENTATGHDLPFLRGDFPEIVETEPNNESTSATPLSPPLSKGGQGGVTANGRFDQGGDKDWYRLRLKKGAGILLEVTAQRHLRVPVDTLLEVYDSTGKKVAENDDGRLFAQPCAHDFLSADSWLPFTAPREGDYFVRLSDQAGTGGPHAMYRFSTSALQPDFQIYQWPDAVPIWGPGTTAAFVVEIIHWGGMKSDIDLRVEGLPPGWTGSAARLSASAYAVSLPPDGGNREQGFLRALLTITAPADASPGTAVLFRVVGKAEQDGRTIEHEAQNLTVYDGITHLRSSPGARAVVAGYRDCWLETSVQELTAKPGDTIQIPVKIHRRPGTKAEIGVIVNGPTTNVNRCSMGSTPIPLKAGQHEVMVPLSIPPNAVPGTRGIVVARSWASDLRQGRPGPCTPLILLHVLPNQEK